MRFPGGLRALNHAGYRRFFAGQTTSQVGSWMQSVAQSWLVLQLTDSPFRLGLIGTIQFAPILLFSILAGALADRVSKRRVLLGTQTALACQALALAGLVWSGHVQYWHVAGLACLLGLANAVDAPARQSYVVELVGREDMVNAVALNSAAFNAARIVGPAIAGVLIARVGVAPAFLLNGLSFAFVIWAIATARRDEQGARPGRPTMLAAIREGVVYAAGSPRIRLILSLLFVVSLCVFNFSVYVPLLARDVLGAGAQGFGFLMAALGVGAVGGALTLGAGRRAEPPFGAIFAAGAVACGGLLAMSTVRHFWVAAMGLLVIGFAGVVTVAGCNTLLQLAAPDELRGRVVSLHAFIFGGTFPFGAFAVGSISEAWSVSAAFLVAGGAGLVGLGMVLALWRLARS
jgi:MFS family permease